jgi:tetratricopeptide (TPR) repeat protein
MEAFAEASLAAGDAEAAEQALRDFASRYPAHVGVRTLLVAVAAQQGSPERLADAQAALAETYVLAHDPERAIVLAEELCDRYPGEPRYQQCRDEARAMLGLQPIALDGGLDAEVVPILEEGDEPSYDRDSGPSDDRGFGMWLDAESVAPLEVVPLLDEELVVDAVSGVEQQERGSTTPPVNPSDRQGSTAEVASPGPAERRGRQVVVEVDLTDRLEGGVPAAALQPQATVPGATHDPPARMTLEGTFAEMRSLGTTSGDDLVSLGRTYIAAGLQDQAIEAFTAAAHDEAQRYAASVALVEVYEARQDTTNAIDWLECVAETAPTPAKRGAALYRLGCLLDQRGETARALAVFLELRTMAPTFRDVRARIARLEIAQGGGGSSVP